MRFVVLHHTGIDLPHFDLMLELSPGSELSTWRLPHWPPIPGDNFIVLSNHRREYLEYEGPISGDRGEVKRVARGDFHIVNTSRGQLIITIEGMGPVSLPTAATSID